MDGKKYTGGGKKRLFGSQNEIRFIGLINPIQHLLFISGYYVYIEKSQHASNDSARLRSPIFSTTGASCMTFWYHMYGADVNRLNLYLGNPGQIGTLAWTRSGNQGYTWQYAQLETKGAYAAQVCFTQHLIRNNFILRTSFGL